MRNLKLMFITRVWFSNLETYKTVMNKYAAMQVHNETVSIAITAKGS